MIVKIIRVIFPRIRHHKCKELFDKENNNTVEIEQLKIT